MNCIFLVSYSFIINGKVSGNIVPSRGLKQGNHISPYLFVLVAEALSGLLIKAVSEGIIHDTKPSRNEPKISHLFFVNDNLLFTRVTQLDCLKIIEILNQYEEASGQKVNFDKLEVSFSKGVIRTKQEKLPTLLSMKLVEKHAKYLGAPPTVGWDKKEVLCALKD